MFRRSIHPIFATIVVCLSVSVMAQAAVLRGTIVDEKTKQPIAGATVELSNSNAGTGYFVAKTGDDGAFSFEDVRGNLYYDLGVLADGYCPYETMNWTVPENQNSVEMTIPLIQGAEIGGKVTVSDGVGPLANARITLTYESGEYQMLNNEQSLFTDKNGVFRFPQIPPNQYRLTVSRGGYIGERVAGIRPQPGDKKEFTIELFKPGSISGTVTLENNIASPPNIEIAARGASQRAGTTDENGFFTIGSLKPGRYQLQSHPSGFHPYESEGTIVLEEGENVSDREIRLTPLPPALTASVRREVFLPEQELIFQIRTFRIGRYQCDVHAIPVNVFVTEELDVQGLTEDADLSSFAISQRWTEDVDFQNPFVWVDRNVKVPDALTPGAYVLRAYSPTDGVESRVLFFITELGIVVKRGEKKTFVYATNLKTSMPVKDAKVMALMLQDRKRKYPGWTEAVIDRPYDRAVWDGQTDERGVAIFEHEYDASFADVIAVSPDGYLAVSHMNKSDLIWSQSKTIYPYTDRPVYRPGQTVFYKAVMRNKEGRDFVVPKDSAVEVTVKNVENDKIYSTTLTTNDWGSINGSFELPGDAPLGRYTIYVKAAYDVQNGIHFYVEEYRKPEFKVEVNSERPFYINGDALAFTVQAEYYFGAPVPNAEVRYRFYESYATGGETHNYPSSYSSFLSSGETKCDAEGMARIEFVPTRSSRDRRVSVEVDVREASGRWVSGGAGVPVGVGSYYITVKPSLRVFDRETPLRLDVKTRTHDEKVTSATLEVEFIQEVWNPVRRRYERPSRPQASRVIQTEEGKGFVEWLPDGDISGRIDAIVRGKDENGNVIAASTRLWRMAFRAGSFDLQYPTLEGVLDKDTYEPGDKATLLINTNYPENPVILTIEGRDILMHRVIWPAGKTTAIEIPVLPEYAPNVYIGLFMPRGENLSTRTYDLNVPERRGDLTIDVETDKEKYKPGETGKVRVKTTLPDGTPKASEVSLAIVDESIFAIRSDRTPDIHSSFYRRQYNWVVTTFSYPLKYYGGANKGVRPDIRKDFRDTALWVANLYTDENGEGTVDATFPDNLTTWRLTARGHTLNTDVGWTRSKTLVTKDIVARLSLPRFFVETDEAIVPSQVNNLSKTNLPDIQTELQVEGGVKLLEEGRKIAQAAAGATARDVWKVSATGEADSATFVFEASGPVDRDALQLSAPVLALGYRDEQFNTGAIEESVEIPLNAEGEISIERSKATLQLTPSLAAVAVGAMPYLTDFPYGCVEQTMNRVLPTLQLLHTLKDLGALTVERKEALDKMPGIVRQRLNRLYSMQNYEGGWSWFGVGQPNLALSAMVVHGLDSIRELGYAVDVNRLRRGIEYLKNNISQTRVWDVQAYATYVLSEVDRRLEPPMLGELYANRNELYDFGLAVSALAFHNRKKEKEANEILDLLLSRISDLSDRHAGWEVAPERMWNWYGTSMETSAWGLKALVAIRGDNPTADRIVQWLIDGRWGNRWRSTRETAAAMEALRTVIEVQSNTEELSDLDYEVSLAGDVVKKGTLTKEDFAKPLSIDIPLKAGTNVIQLKSSRAQGNWSLESSLFRSGEVSRPIPHEELRLNRLYERAIHTRDYRGRPKIMTEKLLSDDELSLGQEILVTLVIKAERDLSFAIVEDALPSGCEVVESFLAQADGYWTPYQRYERRDQKMVFFLEDIPKGETRIEYLMRTEMQGVFHSNPAHAWCMYYPQYSAHSAGGGLRVK